MARQPKIIQFNYLTIIRILLNNKTSLSAMLLCCLLSADNQWLSLTKKQELTISGMARFKNGYVVVHDNKTANKPRVSYIDNNYNINKINWDSKSNNILPFDLEGITSIPLYPNQFILMESSGRSYRVFIDPKESKITLISIFQLPLVTNIINLEGIEMYKTNGLYTIIYGDRGSDDRPSTLFSGKYNVVNDVISDITTFIIDFTKPTKYKRNIADLSLDKFNNLWCVATSDPGDTGPFETFLYIVGSISKSGQLLLQKQFKPRLYFPGQKVEALMFSQDYIFLMTDNESFGASFYEKQILDIR